MDFESAADGGADVEAIVSTWMNRLGHMPSSGEVIQNIPLEELRSLAVHYGVPLSGVTPEEGEVTLGADGRAVEGRSFTAEGGW